MMTRQTRRMTKDGPIYIQIWEGFAKDGSEDYWVLAQTWQQIEDSKNAKDSADD